MVQFLIIILSGSAIWFVSRKESWRRWGYILGLLGQPLWFYTAFKNHQWGILLLCFWYTYCWCQGVWNFWIKPFIEDRRERNRLSREFQEQVREKNRLDLPCIPSEETIQAIMMEHNMDWKQARDYYYHTILH